VSGFVSISLTPMLASRFLRPPHAQRHGLVYNAIEKVFVGWLRLYDVTLRGALRFHVVPMAISIALLVGTWFLFQAVPKGFLRARIRDASASAPRRCRGSASTR
jgi:HAE1 family hydrophobic/amphiphilic exporter-1